MKTSLRIVLGCIAGLAVLELFAIVLAVGIFSRVHTGSETLLAIIILVVPLIALTGSASVYINMRRRQAAL
jgi:hypothetical protein